MKTIPQTIIAAQASLSTFDQQIAKLQTDLDAIPGQEAALSQNRALTPKQIREGLADLRDRKTELLIEVKRNADDRSKVLATASAAFGPCNQLIIDHFKRLAEAQVKKATAALAPFFDGTHEPMTNAFDHIPAVRDAHHKHLYSMYRITGTTVEERLASYCRVIQEARLDKADQADSKD